MTIPSMAPLDNIPVTDPGRRLAGIVNLAILGGHAGRWVAGRISDGGTDGVIYDSHADALIHQLHWRSCVMVVIPKDQMPEIEASRLIEVARTLYDRGVRIADPDNPNHQLITPTMRF